MDYFNRINSITILLVMITGVTLSGCAYRGYRFTDDAPILSENDTRPVSQPEKNDYEKTYYYFNNLLRRPLVNYLDFDRIPRSEDVNSMDEVPSSSWFTPRMGYENLTPQELLTGPEAVGAPVPPFTVVRAKSGGTNPGFFARDARGYTYLVKFDPPEFPAIQTTTALIVNRLFWGFGYNVPEDYLVQVRREEFKTPENGKVTEATIDRVMSLVAEPVDGIYRCTFSLFLSGKILGTPSEKGVRADDPNDRIPHENRRSLRAMKIFGALTNHSDIRIDNSLDVYLEDEQYVKHYLLDFGEAFGGHGAEHDWIWDGYEHYFSFDQVFENIGTLGLKVEPWENISYTHWRSVGAFEAEAFDPATWRETYQFLPIQLSKPDDDYWAAKIVARLSEDHIRTLVEAAGYPEPEAADYIVRTLIERKRKIVDYFYRQVSPIEFVGQRNDMILLKDLYWQDVDKGQSDGCEYRIEFRAYTGKRIGDSLIVRSGDGNLDVSIPDDLARKGGGYIQMDVLAIRDGQAAPSPAQFHFTGTTINNIRLVGIVH